MKPSLIYHDVPILSTHPPSNSPFLDQARALWIETSFFYLFFILTVFSVLDKGDQDFELSAFVCIFL